MAKGVVPLQESSGNDAKHKSFSSMVRSLSVSGSQDRGQAISSRVPEARKTMVLAQQQLLKSYEQKSYFQHQNNGADLAALNRSFEAEPKASLSKDGINLSAEKLNPVRERGLLLGEDDAELSRIDQISNMTSFEQRAHD